MQSINIVDEKLTQSCTLCLANKTAYRKRLREKTAPNLIESRKLEAKIWEKKRRDDEPELVKKQSAATLKSRRKKPNNFIRSSKRYRKSAKGKYVVYKSSAKANGIIFELTLDEASKLFDAPCFYCNEYIPGTLNGIDRVNNFLGYKNGFVVTCCTLCNMLKSCWEYNSFIAYAGHIAFFTNLNTGKLISLDKIPNTTRNSFSEYKTRAIDRNYAFHISEEEFNTIVSDNCHLCGKQNSELHSNGLDRLDNNIGYEKNNLKACCGSCNRLKREHVLTDVIQKCALIYKNKINAYVEPAQLFKQKRIKQN